MPPSDVAGTKKKFCRGYTHVSSLTAPPATFLSLQSSLLQVHFRTRDILHNILL